jgi:hypothetical protein
LPSTPAPIAGDEYSYLEDQLDQIEQSGTKRARTVRGPRQQRNPVAAAMNTAGQGQEGVSLDPDLFAELGGDPIDSLYSGAFSTN